MSKIYKNITELIGKTPLLQVQKYTEKRAIDANLFVKLEYLNPAGSVKDRIAKAMIEKAEKEGKLKKGYVIIEPTSGNTGIGIAAVAAAKGYKVKIVMPETMSIERRSLIKAYGAEVILTEGSKGMKGAIAKAEELAKSIEGSFVPSQFENLENPEIHRLTTGPEIYDDLDGKVDVFIAGVGTGGTISGVGKYLKSKNKDIKIIAVEPEESPVLTKGKAGSHKIQGIGAGFIPKTLDTDIYDEVIDIKNEEAFDSARAIAESEGILVGISAGAALYAAEKLAKKAEYKGKNIVVLLPDTGDRYLSTELFK